MNPIHYEPKTTYECSCCHSTAENALYVHGGDIGCGSTEIVEKAPGWYFYDETWAYRYGPFQTRSEAEGACKKYVESLESGYICPRCTVDHDPDVHYNPVATLQYALKELDLNRYESTRSWITEAIKIIKESDGVPKEN